MSPGRLQWTHYDSSGDLDAVARRGWVVAKARAWKQTPEHQAMFRAWLLSILAQVADLGPSPVRESSGEGAVGMARTFVIEPTLSPDPARSDWQRMLTYGIAALVPGFRTTTSGGKVSWTGPSIPDGKVVHIVTHDGDPPQVVDTAQIGVVEGFVVVGVALALGAAVAWIASQVAEVTATALATDANKQKLVASMTTSAELVEAHRAAELQAGHDLPYDDQEIALLQSLRESIKAAASWEPPPLRSVPNVRGVTDAAADATRKVGEATSYVLPVIVGLVLYEWTQNHSRKRAA